MERYVPHQYPFNGRVLKDDPTNYFKKYENVIFSDKETLKSEPAVNLNESHKLCVNVDYNNVKLNNCYLRFTDY
jgi:hypothetical protein